MSDFILKHTCGSCRRLALLLRAFELLFKSPSPIIVFVSAVFVLSPIQRRGLGIELSPYNLIRLDCSQVRVEIHHLSAVLLRIKPIPDNTQ